MATLLPETPETLAEALASAAQAGKRIDLTGASSKRRMTGPANGADVHISTTSLQRIVEYEPRDLTISVEAGMPFARLIERLDEDRLTLPLDPPFFNQATVGGVVAANTSGPRRRYYGTARDLVIGIKFATLEGKLVQAGGMVVKNAAGFEMGKLLIGSMGTLAGIAVVNFRLSPKQPRTRSFILRHSTLEEALSARDRIVRSVLQPLSLDLLNPEASERAGLADGFSLLAQAGGNQGVVERYARDLPDAEALDDESESRLWECIREFTPAFLAGAPGGAVVRISVAIDAVGDAVRLIGRRPALARAGNGVVYGYFEDCGEACAWLASAVNAGFKPVVEYVAESGCVETRWPVAGSDFAMMDRIKGMFDPRGLLNGGKLYGRL